MVYKRRVVYLVELSIFFHQNLLGHTLCSESGKTSTPETSAAPFGTSHGGSDEHSQVKV